MVDESLPQVARIAAGEFVMGADDGDEDERPVHKAYVDDFAIGICPVTTRSTRSLSARPVSVSCRSGAAAHGVSRARIDFRSLADAYLTTARRPRARSPSVTLVGFEDALPLCLALEQPPSGAVATEAEWERAARGGRGVALSMGHTLDAARAHFLPDATTKAEHGTAPVGSYPPNAFELHDMAGNVWEWVSDWYSPNYYERAQYINPQGPESGLMRIVRGGAWINADGRYLRCAYRHRVPPDTYSYSVGFRIAYSLK